MAPGAGIPETALQSTTSMLGILVWLNDSYTHEQLKTGLHMLQGGINHQVVSVIAQLPALTCSHQFPREMAY